MDRTQQKSTLRGMHALRTATGIKPYARTIEKNKNDYIGTWGPPKHPQTSISVLHAGSTLLPSKSWQGSV